MKKEETQNLLVKKSEAYNFCLGEAELSGKKPSDILVVTQSTTLVPSYQEKALHAQAHWFLSA